MCWNNYAHNISRVVRDTLRFWEKGISFVESQQVLNCHLSSKEHMLTWIGKLMYGYMIWKDDTIFPNQEENGAMKEGKVGGKKMGKVKVKVKDH